MIPSKSITVLSFALLLFAAQVSAAGRTVAFTPGSGLRSVGGQIGIAVPSNYDVGFLIGVQADYEVFKMIDICPSFEFVHAGRKVYYAPGYYDEYSINEFTLCADVRFYPPLSLKVYPYIGGGFILDITSWHYNYPTNHYGYVPSNDYGPGFNFLTGVDFPLGTFIPFVQLKGKLGYGVDMLKLSAGFNIALK